MNDNPWQTDIRNLKKLKLNEQWSPLNVYLIEENSVRV